VTIAVDFMRGAEECGVTLAPEHNTQNGRQWQWQRDRETIRPELISDESYLTPMARNDDVSPPTVV
jgi:hypothetical protein